MTAQEFAQLTNAKRVRRGQWIALCPSHPDRKPSLSIREGKRAILLKCWSQDCSAKDICAALGISMAALWYVQRADPKEIRAAERRHRQEALAEELVKEYRRVRNERLWMWVRVTTALGWLMVRNPDDKRLAESYDFALSRTREAPSTWPNPLPHQAPYCPFPPQKLLHGIKASQVTQDIAIFLKLPR